MTSEFWCASCRRHRPSNLFGAKADKFRPSFHNYCRDCLARRKLAMQTVNKARNEAQ